MEKLKIIHTHRRKNQPKFVDVEFMESSENCCIMHEPINEVDLGFVVNYFNKPSLNGIKLQCGHHFSVSALLYHWLRNSTVLCPVCRQGHKDARLNILSIPPHMRKPLRDKVKQEKESDVHEQIRQDRLVAQELQNECHIIIESYDHRFLTIPCYSPHNIFCVTDLTPLHQFLGTLWRYRVHAIHAGHHYMETPWVRFDQDWVWAGPICHCIQTDSQGHVSSFVTIIT